jgi:hypothetical protein
MRSSLRWRRNIPAHLPSLCSTVAYAAMAPVHSSLRNAPYTSRPSAVSPSLGIALANLRISGMEEPSARSSIGPSMCLIADGKGRGVG